MGLLDDGITQRRQGRMLTRQVLLVMTNVTSMLHLWAQRVSPRRKHKFHGSKVFYGLCDTLGGGLSRAAGDRQMNTQLGHRFCVKPPFLRWGLTTNHRTPVYQSSHCCIMVPWYRHLFTFTLVYMYVLELDTHW